MVFRSILKISNSGNSFFGRKEVLGLEQDSFSVLFLSLSPISIFTWDDSNSRFFSRFFRLNANTLPLNKCNQSTLRMVHYCAEISKYIRAFILSSP
ncbi:hypothetical protein LSS_19947 [Leptospira santarosai serovar Shermani str. LT 821]|uniref:Uncharacterized protein n=1 Tax=Leptospira santarosai serovar Shermani str. LT 821 TaxID=758847 RepID=K8XU55_9LEPT|nr:hypothetical protein LSS_19947 [Leptospira santarosai serovar Shermani str. LT 821]